MIRPGHLAVRVRRVPDLPLVSLRVVLRAGVAAEPVPGLSLVTGRMLGEGSQRRDWREISVQAEDRGMYVQPFGTSETLGVSLDALATDLDLALDWLAELALEPSFPADRLRFVTRQVGAELASLLDQPQVRTGRAFLDQLYHPHPLSRPMQGDEASLESITSDDCARLHARALGWGGCVTVAGEIDEDAVLRDLEERFGALKREDAEAPPRAPEPEGRETRREVRAGDSEQAHLFMGHLTVARSDEDLTALQVAGVILGSGGDLAGRIPQRVREREGLAYHAGVGTTSGAGLAPGRFQAYVGTSPERVEQAERAVREEVERFVAEGPTEAEVDEARAYLLGREPFRRQTLSQWADLMAAAELYGIPLDRPEWRSERLRALDRDGVFAAVRRRIRPQEIRVTLGLPG